MREWLKTALEPQVVRSALKYAVTVPYLVSTLSSVESIRKTRGSGSIEG